MAELIIPLKDDALKTEIEEAFADSYANPDSLSAEDLVLLHVSNFIRQCLNDHRQKVAVDAAIEAVVKADSLTE